MLWYSYNAAIDHSGVPRYQQRAALTPQKLQAVGPPVQVPLAKAVLAGGLPQHLDKEDHDRGVSERPGDRPNEAGLAVGESQSERERPEQHGERCGEQRREPEHFPGGRHRCATVSRRLFAKRRQPPARSVAEIEQGDERDEGDDQPRRPLDHAQQLRGVLRGDEPLGAVSRHMKIFNAQSMRAASPKDVAIDKGSVAKCDVEQQRGLRLQSNQLGLVLQVVLLHLLQQFNAVGGQHLGRSQVLLDLGKT